MVGLDLWHAVGSYPSSGSSSFQLRLGAFTGLWSGHTILDQLIGSSFLSSPNPPKSLNPQMSPSLPLFPVSTLLHSPRFSSSSLGTFLKTPTTDISLLLLLFLLLLSSPIFLVSLHLCNPPQLQPSPLLSFPSVFCRLSTTNASSSFPSPPFPLLLFPPLH